MITAEERKGLLAFSAATIIASILTAFFSMDIEAIEEGLREMLYKGSIILLIGTAAPLTITLYRLFRAGKLRF